MQRTWLDNSIECLYGLPLRLVCTKQGLRAKKKRKKKINKHPIVNSILVIQIDTYYNRSVQENTNKKSRMCTIPLGTWVVLLFSRDFSNPSNIFASGELGAS